MIPLTLPASAQAAQPFVARLRLSEGLAEPHEDDAVALSLSATRSMFSGRHGLFEVGGLPGLELDGDVVIVDPSRGTADRILRAGSAHNTWLITERCDQLCIMCSQPPKKHHDDRFALFAQACELAEPASVIGISGGEPTLYKDDLLTLVEEALDARPDLSFHVLTNGQHFDLDDVARLRDPRFRNVVWGIPIYAADGPTHDAIVAKVDAFRHLEAGFEALLLAGAAIELRTVVLSRNVSRLADLAKHVVRTLPFIQSWSIMQLENIGYARGRWAALHHDHAIEFGQVASALDIAAMHGVNARLFNFPRCTVPEQYRDRAEASISDWKRRYAPACGTCAEQGLCTGFFEWHPQEAMVEMARPI